MSHRHWPRARTLLTACLLAVALVAAACDDGGGRVAGTTPDATTTPLPTVVHAQPTGSETDTTAEGLAGRVAEFYASPGQGDVLQGWTEAEEPGVTVSSLCESDLDSTVLDEKTSRLLQAPEQRMARLGTALFKEEAEAVRYGEQLLAGAESCAPLLFEEWLGERIDLQRGTSPQIGDQTVVLTGANGETAIFFREGKAVGVVVEIGG